MVGDSIPEPTNVPRFITVSLVLFVFFAMAVMRKYRLQVPYPVLFLPILAFYLLNLASVSWSVNKADAMYESQRVLLAAGCIIYFLTTFNTKDGMTSILKAVLVVSALSAIITIYEVVSLPDLKTETLYRVRGVEGHRNLHGSLMFLFLGCCVYAAIELKNTWKWFALIMSVTIFVLLLILQVRSVYIAMMVTILVLIPAGIKTLWKYRRISVPVLLFIVVAISAVLVLNHDVFRQMDFTKYTRSNSGSERLIIWGKTLQLITDHPLLGVGANNWQYNFTNYSVGDIVMVKWYGITFQRPHNDFLWIMSETGIIGFLLIFFIIFIVAKRCATDIRHNQDARVIVLAAVLTGLVADSFFSFNKERIVHIVLAAMLFSLLLFHLNLQKILNQRSTRLLSVIVLVALAFSLVMGFYRVRGEYFTRHLLEYKAKNDPVKVVEFGNRAVSPFYLNDPTSTPIYTSDGDTI
jgi:O-antigen ligase